MSTRKSFPVRGHTHRDPNAIVFMWNLSLKLNNLFATETPIQRFAGKWKTIHALLSQLII